MRPVCPECEANEKQNPNDLWAHSGVNKDGDGFVHLSWGKERGQLSPSAIRRLALTFFEAAGESDSCVIKLLLNEAHFDLPKAVGFVGELRKYRVKEWAKGEGDL